MCSAHFFTDEINRTSPKTQSALLEVMEEGNVTVDGVTRKLPDPFIVIATENPVGSSGTQLLPESQLDRFMICLTMGYPSHEDAIDILKGNAAAPLSSLKETMAAENLLKIKRQVNELYVHDSIYEYIVDIVEKTRESEYFYAGVSPRGSIALLRMAKAMAYIKGKEFVTPEEIKEVLGDVFGHRVILSSMARASGMNEKEALLEVLKEIKVPRT